MKTQKKKLTLKKTAVSTLSKKEAFKLVGGNHVTCPPQFYTCVALSIFDYCEI